MPANYTDVEKRLWEAADEGSVLDKCFLNQIFRPNSSANNEQTDYQVVHLFRQRKSK